MALGWLALHDSRPLLPTLVMLIGASTMFLNGCAHDLSVGHSIQAKQLADQKNYDQAIESAKQSIALDKSVPGGWYWLADASHHKGDNAEVIRGCQGFLAFESSLDKSIWGLSIYNCYFYLGWAHFGMGSYDDAIKHFTIAAQKLPNNWGPYTGRGWAYYKKQSYEEALRDFSHALSINQKDGAAARGRAWVNYNFGKFEAALNDFQAALQNTESSDKGAISDALRGKAFTYLGLGDSETAVGLIKQAKEARDYGANGDLALIFYVSGDKKKAWEYRGGSGSLGIQLGERKAATGENRVVVVGTMQGGPAQEAGLVKGDELLGFNGARITGVQDFITKSIRSVPGTAVMLKIAREGTEKSVTVQVASADAVMLADPQVKPILAARAAKAHGSQFSRQRSSGSAAPAFPASDVDQVPSSKGIPNKSSYAIVIGIEQYREKLPKADFADRDARLMGEYLTKALGYPEENVVVRINDRAAKTDLDKYFGEWLRNNVESGGSVFIYFSGHGAPNPKTGEAYLVPYDGDPSFVESTAYPLKNLYAALEKLPAKDITVVLDSCFSGAGGRSVLAKGAKPMVLSIENAVVAGGKTVVLAASSADQTSSAYEEKQHGLLTYYFLRGLQGEGDLNHDGAINMAELYEYVKPNVQRIARKEYNNEQTPQLLGTPDMVRRGIVLTGDK
jgi:tetratricopeptide (TPR) repeat protein